MKKDSDGLMLLEICLAIVFFALSAAVILQVFVGAHEKSVKSETVMMGTFLAEDAVNALKASGQEIAAFFEGDGYLKTENGFEKQATVNGREYQLDVKNEVTEGKAGTLDQGEIQVFYSHKEEPVHTMPFSRFLPAEVRP